jgi:RNA polymerase sigma-70 factor (ECF subfamily)
MSNKLTKHSTREQTSEVDIKDLSSVYQRPLLRYFQRQGFNNADAHDCVQEVFARMISKGGVQKLENPQGYIFKIANNLLTDKLRKQRSQFADKHEPVADASLFCERPLQERVLAGEEELALVKRAILKMPKQTQRVFVLNRFENLKYKEVAKVLGMSVSGVEKHMMLALKQLHKLRDLL